MKLHRASFCSILCLCLLFSLPAAIHADEPDETPLSEETVIYSVELSGLVTPMEGETPVTAVMSKNSNASVIHVEWFYDIKGSEVLLDEDDLFEADKKYGCYITLEPASGHVFFAGVDVSCGSESARDVDRRDETVTAEFYFSYPEEAVQEIDTLRLERMPLPEVGMTIYKSSEEIEDTTYVSGNTEIAWAIWYEAGSDEMLAKDDVFESGRTYTCRLRLDSDRDERFAADLSGNPLVEVSVNDEIIGSSDILPKGDNTLYVYYTVTMPGEIAPWEPEVSLSPEEIVCKRGGSVTLTAEHNFPEPYDVTYQWYQNTENSPEGASAMSDMTSAVLTVPTDTVGTAYYYCIVTGTAPETNTVYSTSPAAIEPVKAEVVSYEFPFTDVPEDAWYRSYVELAHRWELVNGKAETLYMPDDNMTLAECIKLAACMHQLYRRDEVTLTNGTPWYQSYIDYAKENFIIDRDTNYTEEELNAPVPRAVYVNIFCYAMPGDHLVKINNVPMGSLPDVPEDHPFAGNIYKMYTSGILNGKDSKGTFGPDDTICRSEVAAILVRMMDTTYRVGAPADLVN